MLKSLLKTALRSLLRHKASSLINVLGLSIGISASLVIYLIVHYEFSFDTFHRDGDRIYRVVSKMDFPDAVFRNCGVPVPTVKAVREEVTGLEGETFFITANQTKVGVVEDRASAPKVFRKQQGMIYADNEYFRFFGYRWLAGSQEKALAEPFSVVLTESRAQSYFPGLAPSAMLLKHVTYDDTITVTVTGVVEDIRQTTDFIFQEFISLGTVGQTGLKAQWGWDNWGSINSNSQFFVKLLPGVSPSGIEEQLVQVRKRHREAKDRKDDTQHFLQPLPDIHFNPDYGIFDSSPSPVHKQTLYGLLAVATFLLLLGCINFINLTTAQAAQRAKEIGIRKTLGSGRAQLMLQFLGESFLLTVVASILSVAIAQSLVDLFRDFIPPGVTYASVFQWHVWVFLAALDVIISLFSGTYPALVLARFQPITILRNQMFAGSATTRGTSIRKILTVSQFTVAQVLIIAAVVVSKQTLYSINKDLGYRRDAIVSFHVPWSFDAWQWSRTAGKSDLRRFTLLNRLREIPEINTISLAGDPPASNGTSSTAMKVNNGKSIVETMVEIKYADTSYFGLYGMKLIAGRNLLQSDTTREFVINETFARFLGFSNPIDAIGRSIQRHGMIPIVGVLADFHTKSTHQAIKPLAYSSAGKSSFMFHLALKAGDPDSWKVALKKTESAFKEVYPDQNFESRFFDETIAAFYKTEQNTARLLNWAAGLAIFISCIGLLGLVIHTTNARVKEIGVRKVLGASVTGIVSLLTREFMMLVLVAFLLASPVGWWAMNRWLQDFAFRTGLSWWVFALAGVFAFVTAILTVSVQAFRAASANPVDSLRTE